jgi:hypothetical protein
MNVLISLALLFTVLFWNSCSSVRPPIQKISSVKHSYDKKHNDTAFVGAEILLLKDLRYREIDSKKLVSTKPWTYVCKKGVSPEKQYSNETHDLIIAGSADDGNVYMCVPKSEGRLFINGVGATDGFTLKSDGSFGTPYFRQPSGSMHKGSSLQCKLYPPDVLFKSVKKMAPVSAEKSYWFELIYSGKSGDDIFCTYREYLVGYGNDEQLSVNIKPGFTQNLTYDLSENDTVRFKGIKLKIIDADNEKITTELIELNTDLF